MKFNFKKNLIIGCFFLLTSCASTFNVDINSIASTSAIKNKNYYLVSLKTVNPDSLEFQKFSRYLDVILSRSGYKRVYKQSDANVYIILGYGIGKPIKEIYSYSSPVYGQTGIQSSTTSGTVIGNNYYGRTDYTPSYGITGYQTNIGTTISYNRYLVLTALDKKSKKELWTSIVTSRGESKDLHLVYPVLIAAVEPYIGRNTGHQINASISANNRRVMELNELINSSGAL